MGSAYDWFDQKRTMEILDESQVVPEARAPKVTAEEPKAPPPKISGAAEQWYANLPEKIKPTALRCKFPHIVEQIQRAWESPRQLDRLFNGMMVDDRGGRQGFPFAAILEMHALKDYYFDVLQPEAKHILESRNAINPMR